MTSSTQDKRQRLTRLLNPRSVVVVGSKKADEYNWLKNMSQFTGNVYSVQVDPNEIPGIEELGFKNFTSMKDIPEPIDFILCAVPRNVAPRIVKDAIDVNAAGMVMYTSGFAETGSEDGARLQDTITTMAKDGDLLLVGPNCMGLFNSKLGVRFGQEQLVGQEGHVTFLSQSGSQGSGFAAECAGQGVEVSKVLSFGNGVVLDSPDYLEYFADDPDTHVLAMYLEGTRDGQRLFRTLREATKRKPVIIWKGGRTPDSSRATRSHTASLAVPAAMWETLVKQTGVISTHGVEETVDMCKALTFTKPFTGTRLGLIATAGGHSVEIADAFSSEGMNVPNLSDESYEKLATFFNNIGGSYRNPLEGGGNLASEEKVSDILAILEDDPNIDAIVVEMGAFGRRDPGILERRVQTLKAFKEVTKKPLWACWGAMGRIDPEVQKDTTSKIQEAGVPVFSSIYRAAKAMGRLHNYSVWLQERDK